jgi:hypothetical protein
MVTVELSRRCRTEIFVVEVLALGKVAAGDLLYVIEMQEA